MNFFPLLKFDSVKKDPYLDFYYHCGGDIPDLKISSSEESDEESNGSKYEYQSSNSDIDSDDDCNEDQKRFLLDLEKSFNSRRSDKAMTPVATKTSNIINHEEDDGEDNNFIASIKKQPLKKYNAD